MYAGGGQCDCDWTGIGESEWWWQVGGRERERERGTKNKGVAESPFKRREELFLLSLHSERRAE